MEPYGRVCERKGDIGAKRPPVCGQHWFFDADCIGPVARHDPENRHWEIGLLYFLKANHGPTPIVRNKIGAISVFISSKAASPIFSAREQTMFKDEATVSRGPQGVG